VLLRQSAALGIVLATSVAGVVAEVPDAGALLAAAAVVQLGLACVLAVTAARERERARELIAEGVTSSSVERERQRLLNGRRRLAGSLDRVRATAEDSKWTLRTSRPLFRARVVAQVGPELAEVAALLRQDEPNPAGIVLARRLVFDGGSPLYGDDVGQLRESLDLVRRRLGRCVLSR
jgi:hypothetical protein